MSLTGYMKMPVGKARGLAEQEFELQKDKIRQNNITGDYLALAQEFLDEFVHILRSTRDRSLTAKREPLLQALLDLITQETSKNSGVFRIYGFRAFIKHPTQDYVLAHMDLNGNVEGLQSAELYLALEVMNRITRERGERNDKHADALLRKWLLHELICPIFGHANATKVIDRLYPKGNLSQLLRNVLDRKSSRSETVRAAHRRFSFKTFDLTLEQQVDPSTCVLLVEDIKNRIHVNWLYNSPRSVRECGRVRLSTKKEMDSRIRTVSAQLGHLLLATGLLDDDGNTSRAFRLFVSGSWFWCGDFIEDLDSNIEIDIVYDGDYGYCNNRLKGKIVRQFLGLEENSRTAVQVVVNRFGTDQLERAAVGSVKGRDALRRKLVLLPHESIQLIGNPLECRPMNSGGVRDVHYENLANLADCWREDLAKGKLRPQRADWFNLRVQAIEAYCTGIALDQRAGSKGEVELQETRVVAKLARLGFNLAGRAAGKLLNIVSPNSISAPVASDRDAAPLKLQISQEFGPLPETPATEVLSTADIPPPGISGDHQQSMISFHGVALNTGDVLTGYQGRYRLLKKLGEGAQGGVWASAVLDENGRGVREVAVKIPNRHAEWDWNQEAEWRAAVGFTKEINALSKLIWHPNIIRLEDWYQEGGDVPFYVMETVSGTNLDDYFDNRDFSEKDVVRIFGKLSEGLEALHSEGLVHRDLKPENIMIRDSDGEPVILDFGTASDMEDLVRSVEMTAAGAAKGTPVYMAPEMAARLTKNKGRHLVIGKDSAFHPNGSTRQFRRDDIIYRIDCAEDGYDVNGVRLRATDLSRPKRLRLRIAMNRVMPVLEKLHQSGAITEPAQYETCRIIECDEITFGAYRHGDTLYIERPYLKDKSYESILMGEPELEFRQDIFTMGIMMYQRLTWPRRPTAGERATGKLPFVTPKDRSDVWGAVLARLNQRYRPLSYWYKKDREQYWPVTPSTEAVVTRMLSIDPADRYCATELRHELKQIADAPDTEVATRSDEYRRNVANARVKHIYLWLSSTVILACLGTVAVTTVFPDIPDYLLPSAGEADRFEWSMNIAFMAATSILAGIAGIAFILGLMLIFRRRIMQFVQLQRKIVKRAT